MNTEAKAFLGILVYLESGRLVALLQCAISLEIVPREEAC